MSRVFLFPDSHSFHFLGLGFMCFERSALSLAQKKESKVSGKWVQEKKAKTCLHQNRLQVQKETPGMNAHQDLKKAKTCSACLTASLHPGNEDLWLRRHAKMCFIRTIKQRYIQLTVQILAKHCKTVVVDAAYFPSNDHKKNRWTRTHVHVNLKHIKLTFGASQSFFVHNTTCKAQELGFSVLTKTCLKPNGESSWTSPCWHVAERNFTFAILVSPECTLWNRVKTLPLGRRFNAPN